MSERHLAAWSSQSSTTLDSSLDCYLLRVKRDADCWIVSEDGSAVYGAGRTLLEAMADFWSALLALPDVVERHQPATARVDQQANIARRLTEVRGG